MAEQLGGPFEKFMDWWQCAAVIPSSAQQWHTVFSPWMFQTALVHGFHILSYLMHNSHSNFDF
jgi:hypothetical protein